MDSHRDELKRGADGLYAVCFKNNEKISALEIEKIFSEYGTVMSVRITGPDNAGMVFVRFKEYEEANQCLESFKKSKRFNVRAARNKNPVGASSKFNDSQDDSKSNYVRRSFRDNRSDMESDAKNVGHRQNSDRTSNFKKIDHESEGKNFGQRQGFERTGGFRKSTPHRTSENEFPKDNSETQNIRKSNNYRENESKRFNDNKVGTTVKGGDKPLVVRSELHDDDMPDLVVAAKEKDPYIDVLVANLPQGLEEADLYDMLTRYHLKIICMSEINITGIKVDLLYCHLWFSNIYDADMAENVLNTLTVGGSKLVAIKTQSLLYPEE